MHSKSGRSRRTLAELRSRLLELDLARHCIDQPWLTTTDWPVSALDGKLGEEGGAARDVVEGGEFTVHRFLQHDIPDHVVLADAELLRLLRDLLLDERRADEAGADDVGTHAMSGAFLGDGLGESDRARALRRRRAP